MPDSLAQPGTLRILATALCAVFITACSDSNQGDADGLLPLQERYVLSSEDSVPEGVAFDPIERAFYASSLQGGSITRIAADGTESIFLAADGSTRIGGIKADAGERRLWACAQVAGASGDKIRVYDLDSSELRMEFDLGALTTGGSCNDVALDDAGIAHVSDPANPFLYRLDFATAEGEILSTDPRFADQTGIGLGLNGLVTSADSAALVVARFFPPALFKVSLPDGGDVTEIELSGDELPAPDGLVLLDGDVYIVSNEAVARVRLDENGTRGDVVVVPQISGLSTATTADGELYVIKSEVTAFVLELPLQLPFEIFRVDLAAFDR